MWIYPAVPHCSHKSVIYFMKTHLFPLTQLYYLLFLVSLVNLWGRLQGDRLWKHLGITNKQLLHSFTEYWIKKSRIRNNRWSIKLYYSQVNEYMMFALNGTQIFERLCFLHLKSRMLRFIQKLERIAITVRRRSWSSKAGGTALPFCCLCDNLKLIMEWA